MPRAKAAPARLAAALPAERDYGVCACGAPWLLRHECYHWPPAQPRLAEQTTCPARWAGDILVALTAAETIVGAALAWADAEAGEGGTPKPRHLRHERILLAAVAAYAWEREPRPTPLALPEGADDA
jgi:hypothetical protein